MRPMTGLSRLAGLLLYGVVGLLGVAGAGVTVGRRGGDAGAAGVHCAWRFHHQSSGQWRSAQLRGYQRNDRSRARSGYRPSGVGTAPEGDCDAAADDDGRSGRAATRSYRSPCCQAVFASSLDEEQPHGVRDVLITRLLYG